MGSKRKIHFAWWVLLGLCITVGLGKSGINNGAGLFLPPVSKDLGIGMGTLTLYLSISAVATLIFLPIGGKLMAKYDTRLLLSIAIILQAGSFAAFGLMNSVWGWYIFSIPLAVGGVFITVLAGPVLINTWFKKKSGLALGIMTAAGGLIGVFTQPAIGNLITNQGWRNAYFIVGIGIIIIIVPTAIFLLRKSPQEKGLLPFGMEEVQANGNNNTATNENTGISFTAARKSVAFIMLTIFFFVITSAASFAAQMPTFLTSKGYSLATAGNIMGAYMLGVLVGSLVMGYLIDKIGARNTTILAMSLGIVSMALLIFSSGTMLIITGVVLFGVVTSSIGTIAPALTSSLFGNKDYSQIYSSVSLGLAVAAIFALPAYGYIYDFTGTYTAGLYAIIAMMVINIICVIVSFNDKEKMVQKGLWN